jgi:hypothetical protein
LGIAGWEQLADVSHPRGAQNRVDQGVGDHIAVRVACEPSLGWEIHAAEDECRFV